MESFQQRDSFFVLGPAYIARLIRFNTRCGSVVVNASALYDRVLSSRPGPGMGMYGVTASQHWTLCISRDSDYHVNVGTVLFNWGRTRTIEDDMHPGSNYPHWWHEKVGLLIMS